MEITAVTCPQRDVEFSVGGTDFSYLRDHAVQDVAVLPGSAFISFAAGANPDASLQPICFKNMEFHNVCYFPESGDQTVHVVFEEAERGELCFRSFTTGDNGEERILHASGAIGQLAGHDQLPQSPVASIEELRPAGSEAEAGEAFYARLRRNGNGYGPAFQAIEEMNSRPGEALARLRPPLSAPDESGSMDIQPAFLDACLHTLAGAHRAEGRTFVLKSIESLCVHAALGDGCWSHARITEIRDQPGAAGVSATGEVRVYDNGGRLVLEALGVCFQYHADGERRVNSDRLFAVSATFTAEPIEPCLGFWTSRLGIPGRIEFAPYNQVFQQLLDPTSLLAKNDRGANVLLVRLEDWLRFRHDLKPRVSPARQSELLAGKKTHQLPGGPRIAHIEAYETEYLFKEIFSDEAYLRHGITLQDGDCVFDVGANIGLFSLFVASRCQNPRIFAFEPSPAAYDCLAPNLSLYCTNATALNCGLSDVDRELPFTFYPRSSVFSSYRPDPEQDFEAVRAVVRNMLTAAGAEEDDATDTDADDLMKGRLTSQTVQCQFRSLSSVIREQGVEQIDLLKIDVEKAELDVLRGISEADWSRIKQVVIEVHDAEGSVLAEVRRILQENGYQVAVEEEDLLEGAGLYNVYATREGAEETADASSSPVASAEVAGLREHAEELIQILKSAAGQSNVPILVALLASSPQRLADDEKRRVDRSIHKLIADELHALDSVHVVGADEIARLYPVAEYYDAHGDQLGHVPYSAEYFASLSTALARRLHALTWTPYKVIVLDCDNTLWGGVCGEVGPEGVDVGGQYAAVQRFMVDRHDEGLLLCLCSKNSEDDVRAVFRQHPEMPLREEHLVATRVNWRSKSNNIVELSRELNLGLDSFIFLDDNPVECAEVRANLPEVLTLQLPPAAEVPELLDHVWAFDQLHTTEEDRKRTVSYRLNVERERVRATAPSLKAFLERLQLEVCIEPLNEEQLARAAQLTQRTNQFNFTTRRRSEAEIRELANRDDIEALAVDVRDRFGDYGFVGLMIARLDKRNVDIDTFLLSCRVLGRGVEHRMFARLGEIACQRKLPEVCLHWLATGKNRPAHDFLKAVGKDILEDGGNTATACIPADQLLTLRYQPDETSPSEVEAQGPGKLAAQGDTGAVRPLAADHALYEEISSDLRNPEVVLARSRSEDRKTRRKDVGGFVEPETDREKTVARIWQEVLAIDHVGVYDHFFQIGGTSLKAVQVISKLRREFGVKLPAVTLFDRSTVRDLAALLDRGDEAA